MKDSSISETISFKHVYCHIYDLDENQNLHKKSSLPNTICHWNMYKNYIFHLYFNSQPLTLDFKMNFFIVNLLNKFKSIKKINRINNPTSAIVKIR